jgi:hypothetical protein
MPRPRALDDIKRSEVCALVSVGCSLDMAARYVGCNTITIRREALRNPDFGDRLRQSELGSLVSPLRAVRRAAENHWRAAAWLLEHVDPDQFVRRKPNHLSPKEIEQYMVGFTEMLDREIEDREVFQRVSDAISEQTRHLRRRMWALETPRRDPRRRQPLRPPTPPWLQSPGNPANDPSSDTIPDKT